MNDWTRKQPGVSDEQGDYMFKHVFYITAGAKELVTYEEMISIIEELRELATKNEGIDYLQVYERGEEKIWIIDQISSTMVRDGHYKDVDGYTTILLPSEY